MARYVNQIPAPVDPNAFTQPIADYMTKEGFQLVDYKGTKLWKKGVGVLTAPQYLSISYGPDFVRIEAFIRYALLPGVYVGEMGISGGFGAIPKSMLKSRVQQIEQYILSMWSQPPQPQRKPIQRLKARSLSF